MTEMRGLPERACPPGCHGGYYNTDVAYGWCQAGNWGWFSAPCVKDCPIGQQDCSGTCVPLGTDAHCSSCGACAGGYSCVSGSCVLAPDSCAGKTVATPCGGVDLPSAANGATSTVKCPLGGCSGTLSAVCTSGVFGEVTGGCVSKACMHTVTSTAICGDTLLPAVPGGETVSIGCPFGCSGAVSATCIRGAFTSITENCEPLVPGGCPAFSGTVGTASCAKSFSTDAAATGTVVNVGCGGTCTGNLSLRCAVGGAWVGKENTCVPLPVCGNGVMEGLENCDGNTAWCPPVKPGDICYKVCNSICTGYDPCRCN